MNTKSFAKIIFCIGMIYCNFSESSEGRAVYPPFHKATSEAEKKLEYVLQWTCVYPYVPDQYNVRDYIEKWPHTKPNEPLEFPDLFTKDFIYAWSKEEKQDVDSSCDGKYIEDDMCGMEFNVLHCGQDCDEDYVYRTIEETDDYAIIQYTWHYPHVEELIKNNQPLYTAAYSTYKLVKRNDVWVIDGLMCEDSRFSLNFGRSKD